MGVLGEDLQRPMRFGFLDLHRRMAEMEALLAQSAVPTPFSQHINDLSPTEARVVQDYFSRARSTMVALFQELFIPLEIQKTSLRWALQVSMTALDISLSELEPKKLAAYGELSPEGHAAAQKVQLELQRLFDRLSAYLQQGLGRNLQQRLERMDATPASIASLRLLEQIVARWHLVEFRPVLDTIIRRLEAPQFEVAVFGRVSSGKSSLLNHIAGMDVLPVGITPITAVPTRLARGNPAAVTVSFADLPSQRLEVEHLKEYASEEGNPNNHKHVTSIVVQLPSTHLRDGVVLVDTPGIGSLALAGSAETFAYLPHCDLGIVLIDAGSTLNADDLTILRTLYEAGTPAQVLLSKADLLSAANRQRMADYIAAQLRRELGLELSVHAVSTVAAEESLLKEWFEHQLAPMLDRHRALTEASFQRKISHLRESVGAVLETVQARGRGGAPAADPRLDFGQARQLLEHLDAATEQARQRGQNWAEDDAALANHALDAAAKALVSPGDPQKAPEVAPVLAVFLEVFQQRGQVAYELVTGLRQTLSQGLETLRRLAPLVDADVAAVRDWPAGGLPVFDLAPLQEQARQFSAPWWGALSRRAAVWTTRRNLEARIGPALVEQLGLYDRQLRAWLRGSIKELTDVYDSQAELYREQIRRLSAHAAEATGSTDTERLAADLQLLQQGEVSNR